MSLNPSLGGQYVLGTAVHSVHIPNPSQIQFDAFFGVSGLTSLWGGSRGRAFEITGVFVGPDIPTVLALEAALLSMDDGIARVYIDTQGRAWPNVIFASEYQPSPEGPRPTAFGGWCLQFRCLLRGLS